jgi:RNA polymerase sigma-54 factor
MRASLQFKLSQHLALTPQLQQSIKLLQMSTLELHQEVAQMLEQNPFLDPQDEDADWDLESGPPAAERQAGSERERTADAESSTGSGSEGSDFAEDAQRLPELDASDFGTTEREDWANGTERDDFDGIREAPMAGAAAGGAAGSDEDDFDPQARRSAPVTLSDHLHAQVAGLRLSREDAAAVQALIESLDDDGYLVDSLEEIASALGPQLDEDDREDLLSRLRCALHWLHRLDPTGVGARSLSECLMLQLKLRERSPAREVALVICASHLDLLARRDVRKLAAATGADEALLRESQALIVACEPKPGRAFADAESNVVVPDVVVRRSGRGFKVTLNPDVMPRLRLNDVYAAAIRGQRGGPMSARLQEARWFIKNIQQRFDTIVRVSEAIVERQKAFFTHGEIAMKPLVLREIADELGLHESTISRVTTAKYMATPQGTFELKYFFGSALATETGGNASSTAVRALIKQMVAAEDPRKPLSDSTLSEMLEAQGIQVARRTVAKYREALKIAPANVRKAL